jgi:hypothetical protein
MNSEMVKSEMMILVGREHADITDACGYGLNIVWCYYIAQ